MDREMIGSGRTYEDAVADACQKLGVDPESVDYEVLERPRTALFGLKHLPAKVKVTVKDEYMDKFAQKAEEQPARAQRQPREERPKQERAPQQPQQPVKQAAPAPEKQPAQPPKEQPQKAEPRPERPKQERAPQQQPAQPKQERAPQPEKAAAPAPERHEDREPAKDLPPEVLAEKGEAAAAYVREVLAAFGFPEAKVTVGQKEGMIALQLEGENLGAVVGRRGDNLDAMQYLASLVANRADGGYCRVVLDVDDYRSKREASLQAYARKMASQAVRSGRSTTLEPMNPYERRIVHSAVQTVEGATSKSIGSEPNRRVVISAIAGAKPQQDRTERPPRTEHGDHPHGGQGGRRDSHDGHGDRGPRGGRGGRDDRDRRDSQKVILPPSDEPPKSDDPGASLYGKIEL